MGQQGLVGQLRRAEEPLSATCTGPLPRACEANVFDTESHAAALRCRLMSWRNCNEKHAQDRCRPRSFGRLRRQRRDRNREEALAHYRGDATTSTYDRRESAREKTHEVDQSTRHGAHKVADETRSVTHRSAE